ncbi:unnamed protein product [Nippostrongylus brasiliensis]|uniref:CCHC-type domain-containing protein n=1 Tax=Nippostrongylus brasiliensis TaxID=27835 RepID=A0A0N4YJU2_NIPBR|nr:unnamed protein product [Nippostrongylus brasiliensis]
MGSPRKTLNKILLETDPPYFKPAQYHSHTNNDTREDVGYPPMAGNVAIIVARVKNVDVNEVIKTATENTRRVYRIHGKKNTSESSTQVTPSATATIIVRTSVQSPPPIPSDTTPQAEVSSAREVFTIPKTPSDKEKSQTIRHQDDNHKDSIRDLKHQLREARASRAAAGKRLKVFASQRHIMRKIGSETPDDNIPSALICAFCEPQGCHFSDACPIVVNSTTRKVIIDKGRGCSTCLKAHSKYLRCEKHDEPCRYCKQPGHNSALCDTPEIENTRQDSGYERDHR